MKKYSPKLTKTINLLTSLSCLIVVGILSVWILDTGQTNLTFVIIFLMFQASLMFYIWMSSTRFINIKISILSINITYILVEFVLIFFTNTSNILPMKSGSLLNSNFIITQPIFHGNTIRGYKLVGEDKTCRNFKMTNGIVEYDVKVNINNIGVSSHFDYYEDKPDSVKRYIVFGDSFSAGLFLDSSWVDKIQADFAKNNIPIQLYNFSVDGGGIMNWYSIFYNEIIPSYDFDGIIIMSYIDNLTRQFFYVQSEQDWVYGSYHDQLPPQYETHKNNKGTLYSITSDSTIQLYFKKDMENTTGRFTLPLLELILLNEHKGYDEKDHLKYLSDFIGGTDYFRGDSISDLNYLIGSDKYYYLNEMLSYCAANQKDIILAAAPDKVALKYYKKHNALAFNQYFDLIAAHYKGIYFNTYDTFNALSKKEIKSHWHPYDFHWNQKGSNYFAKYFKPFLKEKTLSPTEM